MRVEIVLLMFGLTVVSGFARPPIPPTVKFVECACFQASRAENRSGYHRAKDTILY
jgi:hypothetical protein